MSPPNGSKGSHNPKVAGSNPAPATSQGPSKEGPWCFQKDSKCARSHSHDFRSKGPSTGERDEPSHERPVGDVRAEAHERCAHAVVDHHEPRSLEPCDCGRRGQVSCHARV